MRNETELKKLFPKFKRHLNDRLSQATNTTLEFEFLSWWCETNYEGYVRLDYTDASGDGKIDAVVQRPNGELIAIQAKYNDGYAQIPADVDRCSITNWEPFDLIAIPAFRNRNKFDAYIQSQSIPTEKKVIYEKIFDVYQRTPHKVKFEFVTTYDVPRNIEDKLTNLFPANFLSVNSVMSLFQLQEHHQSPPAPDLVLTVDESNTIVKEDTNFKIISYLAEVNLKEIIKYMQDNYPDYSIISKNVRTFLKSGSRTINENIRLTYEDEPDEFFYSHNGITILCEALTKSATTTSKTKFTLAQPNVINGGQTIMTLRDVSSTKINDDGTVLVKIFEIENNKDNEKLKDKIIYRTNQQNAIHWHNLRANEESQYILGKHFLRRDVYYERRQNEAKLNKSKIKASKLLTVGIQEMAQILKICQDGPDGVVFAMQKKKQLFADEALFEEVFNIEPDVGFFQMMLFKLVDTICADLKKGSDMKFVKRTIFALIYFALKDSSILPLADFDDYVTQVNANRHIFNYKIARSKFIDLRSICSDLFKICIKEQKAVLRKRKKRKVEIKTAATPRIFISEVPINEVIFGKVGKAKRRKILSAVDKIFTHSSNPAFLNTP